MQKNINIEPSSVKALLHTMSTNKQIGYFEVFTTPFFILLAQECKKTYKKLYKTPIITL